MLAPGAEVASTPSTGEAGKGNGEAALRGVGDGAGGVFSPAGEGLSAGDGLAAMISDKSPMDSFSSG